MGTARLRGNSEEGIPVVIHRLLDVLYPRHCAVCGRVLDDEDQCLCTECLADMPLTYFWQWRENPAEKILWGRCRFETVTSLFYYHRESEFSNLTRAVKYLYNRKLGLFLGNMLGRSLRGNIPAPDAVVPVPVHPLKKWRRGYNQAEIIAAGISKAMNVPVWTDILRRKRWSRSQTRTDVGNKWENVESAFSLNRNGCGRIGGKHILLVDDVLTTGATAEACWKVLSQVQEARISFSTLAFVE